MGPSKSTDVPFRDTSQAKLFAEDLRLRLAGKRILIIEDDFAVREICLRSLRRMGCEVEAFADAEQGLVRLMRGPVDLLVTDHAMPKLSGLDLLGCLRRAGNRTPALMISGAPPNSPGEWMELLSPGLLLIKPFAMDVFLKAVDQLLTNQP